MSVNITFLGGAGTVTGSKYLVTHGEQRLLVDCGLFQGYKQLRLRNWNPLLVTPTDVDAVLLTHAHLDHSGYLPLLYRQGFRGRVHATAATCDLCGILLPDSGHIQEEDAAFLNRHGYTKHSPALPLYGKHDALLSLQLLHPVGLGKPFSPLPGWTATFSSAGHILGAASVELRTARGSLRAVLASASNSFLPSSPPCAASLRRSGCGIMPSTLPASFNTPAMSRAEPLTASA